MTIQGVDRGIYEVIRKAIVAAGWLPDITLYNTREAYEAAKDAIRTTKGGLIDVYGVGTPESRGEKKDSSIFINRERMIRGSLGAWGVTKHEPYDDNGVTKYKKLRYPDGNYDILYYIRSIGATTDSDRILQDIIFESLSSIGFLLTVNPDGSTNDDEPFFIGLTGGSGVLGYSEFFESMHVYEVLDVWITKFTELRSEIPELTTVEPKIWMSTLTGTEETTIPEVVDIPFSLSATANYDYIGMSTVSYQFAGTVIDVDSVKLFVDGTEIDEQTDPFAYVFNVAPTTEGVREFKVIAYKNGVELDSVTIAIPYTLTLTAPTENDTIYTDGNIQADFTTNRLPLDGDRVELLVDGTVVQSMPTPVQDSFNVFSIPNAGAYTISIRSMEGMNTLAEDSVNVNVELQLVLTITQPTQNEKFDNTDTVTVTFQFNRLAPEVDKVEIYLNGSVVETRITAPFDADFTISGLSVALHNIEVIVLAGAYELSSENVDIEVEAAVPTFDADTIAYMNALAIPDNASPSMYTGLTNNQLWHVVDNRVVAMKATGVWADIPADYPLMGDTAAMQSYNIKNPSLFQLTWYGGWVHTKEGALGNGINTYANGGLKAKTVLSDTSNGLTIVNGGGVTGSMDIDAGCFSSGVGLIIAIYPTELAANLNGAAGGSRVNISTPLGITTGVRKDSTSKFIKDGTLIHTFSASGNLVDSDVYFGTFNNAGSPSNATKKRYQGFGAHFGLTNQQGADYHSIINDFETALGRKTW